MDPATIEFARTELEARKSNIRITENVTRVLAELHRLNSADCITNAIDGVDSTSRMNILHADIDALAHRHSGESPERIKEMID